MAKKSITKRWIFNNLGVVVLALLVIDMVIVYAIQNYFYSSARQYLVSKLNAVTSVLSMYSQDSSANFSAEMRNMLETFNEKDKIELTQVEYQILEFFMNNKNTALDRASILNHIWGESYYGDDKIVDVNIRRIRMKIEEEPSSPKYIITIWGYGYKWNDIQ